MPKFTVRMKKDGRVVAHFLDAQDRRVRTTRAGIANWVAAEQVGQVLEYGRQLQLEQCAAAVGSDGSPMPALQGSGTAVFVARVNGRAVFERRSYAQQKAKDGGEPVRNLRGPGKGGHMLDDLRMNFLDDRRGSYAINTRLGRIKALANEQRAEWWGWSPESEAKLREYAGEVYGSSVADHLIGLGLAAANVVAQRGRSLRRVA